MSHSPPPDRYPVELRAPDIEPYRNPDGAYPWITTLEADTPGPHVAITAIVHGNELCGAIALDWLFRQQVAPLRGKLSLSFVNIGAYGRFDPTNPTQSRWVEEDLNRVWDAPTLDGPRQSWELSRARAIRPWVDDVDLLLDLHSMQHRAEPLILTGGLEKGVLLGRAVGVPRLLVSDHGHVAGRRLRDYAAFDDPASDRAAILVECGQHWERAAAEVAIVATVRFLRATGVVAPNWQATTVPLEAPVPQRRIDVTDAVTVNSHDFRFTGRFEALDVIAKAGTVIASDAGVPITTPYDDCVLIMPSHRLWPGQTAVRLGRFLD